MLPSKNGRNAQFHSKKWIKLKKILPLLFQKMQLNINN